MPDLKINDIVTVVHPEWRFTGKQGQVVEIVEDGNEDGPIGVRFPEYYSHLFAYPDKPDTIVRFQISDLKRNTRDDPQDINLRQLGGILFGSSMWHTIYCLGKPLMIGFTDCMHEGCSEKALVRIMVNCFGTVCEADVCKEHFEYHGRNCDGFPFKKQAGSSTADTSKLVDAIMS